MTKAHVVHFEIILLVEINYIKCNIKMVTLLTMHDFCPAEKIIVRDRPKTLPLSA